MKRFLQILFVITLMSAGFYWNSLSHSANSLQPSEASVGDEVDAEGDQNDESTDEEYDDTAGGDDENQDGLSADEDLQLKEEFSSSLDELSDCLNLEVPERAAALDLTFENLNTILSPAMGGGSVVEENEWTATDLRLPSGEARRIFVQTVPDENGDYVRKLQYFSVDAKGELHEMTMAADQAMNPSEALIASLEADGQVTGKSEARKIFYPNGEEMHIAENQGKIYSFELSREGKLFRCTGLSRLNTFNCQCH